MTLPSEIFEEFGNVFVEDDAEPVSWIPFGILPLDIVTGGGIPEGRIVEIYGWESTGKSTLTLQFCANAQKSGGIIVYNDAEFVIDSTDTRLKQLGLDSSKGGRWRLGHPKTVEEMFDIIRKVSIKLRAKKFDKPIIQIIDSVAAAPARMELEGSAQLGIQAKVFNTEFRKSISNVFDNNVTLICINHSREKFGVMFGDHITTPGGKALKFYATLRLQLNVIKRFKGKEMRPFGFSFHDDDPAGFVAEVKTIKNKSTTPMRSAYCVFLFHRGGYFHNELSMFETMRQLDLCRSKGNNWIFKGCGECSKAEMFPFIQQNTPALSKVLRSRYFEEEDRQHGKRAKKTADDGEAADPARPAAEEGAED